MERTSEEDRSEDETSEDAALKNLRVETVLTFRRPLVKEHVAFGPKIASICEAIQTYGSLYSAVNELGIAYSNAWESIRRAEAGLQVKLVVRGSSKGYVLTPAALQLLDAYQEISEDVSRLAAYRMQVTFGDQE